MLRDVFYYRLRGERTEKAEQRSKAAGGVSPKIGGNGAEERGVSGRQSWTEAHGGRGLMDAERRRRLNGPQARARGE